MVLGISRQTGSDRFTNNLQLVQNLVDWGVEDVELLSIRSRGTYARTLLPVDARRLGGSDAAYEAANYGFVVLALGIIAVLTFGRRRRMTPIDLDPASKRSTNRPLATEVS
jgi:ABC-2 type transport system permease protein